MLIQMAFYSWLCSIANAFVVLWALTLSLNQVHGVIIQSNHPERGCDFSVGSWVIDSHQPFYDASRGCPFIVQGFNCLGNGRPDQEYVKYKWKPFGCHLPRFDGKKMLERYRGKKIMFVGDSLSNNMWQSLTCLLHTAVPNSDYTLTTQTKQLSVFFFPEYQASIMWLKDGFLVDVVHDKEKGRIVKLDSVRSGDQWKGVDALIFNTYHWWTHIGETQTHFQLGSEIVDMDHLEAFRIGLTTWAKWIDSNIDPSRTSVLFQGIAATHYDGNGCAGQTNPMQGSQPPYPGADIVKNILHSMKNPIHLLDITLLTQLRIDGHPSLYSGRGASYVDCSHWCLAGVPDTWNEFLYAALIGR
ncbi:PREDICTED: protein trichome birefringence-like 42 [Lupinus angustifolius]|nr:PREDICTED: protein trichome birefringence-like 42 [Lupinus angustifolius]